MKKNNDFAQKKFTDGGKQGNFNRDFQNKGNRDNFSNRNYSQRPISRRQEETLQDIIDDIARIEKEIQLEISEIKSFKLGV